MSVALVLSGGGSKGDFELGAIRYLYEVQGIRPTLIAGTSVGAINGAKLAEGEVTPQTGLRGLAQTWYLLDVNEDMWRFEPWVRNAPPELSIQIQALADTHLFSYMLPTQRSLVPRDLTEWGPFRDLANAVQNFCFLMCSAFKFGSTIAAGAEASSVANLEPIRDRIYGRNGFEGIFNEELIAQWAAAGNHLRLGSVSLDSGELRFITEAGQILDRRQQPLVDSNTRQLVVCDLREAIIASASIGMVFPPVKLASEYYVDGGHRTVIPVDPILHSTFGIQSAFLVSASTIGLSPSSFQENRAIGNIAVRSIFEASLAEIVHSEISPRGGWGSLTVTLIAPTLEVHGMVTIDPGLIRINADYGWMRADDTVNGRGPGDRLFELADEITWHRARIWFNEGRYLESFPLNSLGEYANLPSYRIDLQRLIDERRSLGGSLPPGVECCAQIGEAHSVRRGAHRIVNLLPFDGATIATARSADDKPILILLDSLVGDTPSLYRNSFPNDNYQLVCSTHHQESLVDEKVAWRVVGRSKFTPGAAITCIQANPSATLLLAADQDGTIVRAEATPDGCIYTGWLPINEGRTAPGGWVTGASRRPGSFDIFVVGTDGHPYTAFRHSGEPNWGGWWGGLPVRDFVPGAPISAVSRSLDLLDLFAADRDGKIVTAAWSPSGGWGGWWEISFGTTAPGGHIAAVSCAPDVLDLFVVGTDGHVARSMWSPATHPWTSWTSLGTAGSGFFSGSPIGIASPERNRIVIALSDREGYIQTASFVAPDRAFGGFTQIGARQFSPGTYVSLIPCAGEEVHAYAIGSDRCVYRAILAAGLSSIWSDWVAISSPRTALVTPGAPFADGTMYGTTDSADQIEVRVQENAVTPDTVEFELEAGPGIDWFKAIKLVAGPSGRGTWSEPGSLGGNLTSGPAVALNVRGGLVVFARGTDKGIWHTWQEEMNGQWSSWQPLGGELTSSPTAAMYRDGRLNLFARGTDNAIWYKWQTQPFGEWVDWQSLGGSLTSGPAVALNVRGGLVVFARGTDKGIWHTWQEEMNGQWSSWQPLGGELTSSPAAAMYRDGRLNLFARGTDNAIWYKWQTQPFGEWVDWQSLGGDLTSEPAVTLNALGGLVLFALGTDNGIWYRWQDQINGEWHPWQSLGGSWTSAPCAGLYLDGRINLFARKPDAIWTQWQTSLKSGGWTIYVENSRNVDRGWMYIDQLPKARLEFYKAKEWGTIKEVSRTDIEKVKPGSKISFRWVRQ
jgi:predicted acylesterase/phospholipase RssA